MIREQCRQRGRAQEEGESVLVRPPTRHDGRVDGVVNKAADHLFFFLALPVTIGCIQSSPSNTILGGYMLACLYTHSFARSHASSSSINGLAFSPALSLSLPLLRSTFVPFFLSTHFSALLLSSKLLECKIRLPGCMQK